MEARILTNCTALQPRDGNLNGQAIVYDTTFLLLAQLAIVIVNAAEFCCFPVLFGLLVLCSLLCLVDRGLMRLIRVYWNLYVRLRDSSGLV